MGDSGQITDKPARPEYEPFPIVRRRRNWLNAVDGQLRRRLPPRAYLTLLGGVHGLRRMAGHSPGRGRILPDFVIVGAAKAGTTSLYTWLCAHPYIARAGAKEIDYFSYHHYRGVDWYRHFFPTDVERAEFAAEHGRPFLTGEASPSYLLDRNAPARAAKVVPGAKLIVNLRDPVDRAYSQFQMRRRDKEEPIESFLTALAAEDPALRVDGLAEQPEPGPWVGRSYLARSRYAEQLGRWLEHFPREQLHFVEMEDLGSDPQATLQGVHEFLGLPPYSAVGLKPMFVSDYDPLTPDARQLLHDYFRPHNQRLYELLGRDFGWDRSS